LAVSRRDFYPDEERWQTIGMIGQVIVLVVHTMPQWMIQLAKRQGGCSAPEKQPRRKGGCMKQVISKQLTTEQQAELEALSAMPDEQIDTADIEEIKDWSNARRGVFYRPIKQQITLRLDADLIAWFKSQSKAASGQGYQTSINRALREYVAQQTAKG
jgi:uncharacterized protein (DUF4415 family)